MPSQAISTLSYLFLFLPFSLNGVASECADPLTSIMTILDCVIAEDVDCASQGYDNEAFVKLHNGVDTNTVIDSGGSFWSGTFALIDIILDYDHQINVGPNQASIRYVEKVIFTNGTDLGLPASNEYPFGQEFIQHEHALVTVDDDCKMILWDQYGDNKEQKDVDEFVPIVLCAVRITSMCDTTTTTTPPPRKTKKSKKHSKKKADFNY